MILFVFVLSIYTRTPPRKFCPLKGARLGRARDFQNGDFVLSRGGCVSQLCGKELRENEGCYCKNMYKLKTRGSRREGELCFCYSGFIYLLA